MADEKSPKPKIELGEKDEKDVRDEKTPQAQDEPRGESAGSAVRAGANRVSAWVHATFPGHENAFWGGVLGLLAALVFFAIGLWRTLLIAALVLVGVAVGQVVDGDPKIIDLLRSIFNRNNQ